MADFARKKSLVVPDNPHFFRPIIMDFHCTSIDIPVFFWKSFLEGLEPKEALLRSSQLGKVWPVKLSGNRIVQGWKEFYGAHELKLGNFVVFRHEGDMVFDVMVFEPSACLREYQVIIPKEEGFDAGGSSDHKQNINVVPAADSTMKERKKNKQEVVNCEGKSGHCSDTIERPNRCEVTMRPYSVSHLLFLPKEFTRGTELDDRQCSQVTIRDEEEGRLWAMNLGHREPSNAVFFHKDGWQKFRVEKSLEDGDAFVIQLVDGGKCPLLSFKRLNGNQCSNHHGITRSKCNSSSLSCRTGKSSHAGKPFSCGTIRPSTLSGKWFMLVIPRNFALSHGLINRDCEMILKNQKGKSWPMRLSYNRINGIVYIGEGFRKFALENDLKEGDRYKLVLIQGGKKPVMLYSHVKERKKIKQEVVNGERENGHCSDIIARPNRCEVTMRPYSVSHVLFLPKKFTRGTELDDRQCSQVTLRDEEEGRLWAVNLGHREPKNEVFFRKDGWQKFRVEKSLEDGDAFVLQLVDRGKNPLLSFKRLNGNQCSNHHEMTRSESNSSDLSSRNGKSSHSQKPFFCSTIRPSNLNGKWFKLLIPKNFARSHGLTNRDCEMILKNQKGKSWPVRLSYNRIRGIVYIGEGFPKFALENDLKEGDSYKLVLILGGKKPIMLYSHVDSSDGTRSKRRKFK